MLKHLHIQNYALIQELDIDFSNGFSVMTGETGAGKSIILGALNLLMGARADSKAVSEGQHKCIVEGVFEDDYTYLNTFFADHDLDFETEPDSQTDMQIIIRRELTEQGKSRAFINDTPVALTTLKDLSVNLIDIHSQHQNLLMGNSSFCQQLLDSVADNNDLLQSYRQLYAQYTKQNALLQQLKEEKEKAEKEADYKQFQFNQLKEARLTPGELQELEKEQQLLQNAEQILQTADTASLLLQSDNGILASLKTLTSTLKNISPYLPQEAQILERINSVTIELKDIAAEIDSLAQNTSVNPERLTAITERADLILGLMLKHKLQTDTELIELRDQLQQELQSFEQSDEQILKIEKEIATLQSQLTSLADKLHKRRSDIVPTISRTVGATIAELAMPNAKLTVSITQLDRFTPTGIDSCEFLFAANKNQTMQSITTASGGELSRLMLAIKSLLAEKKTLPTLIFDEIDTGVSGEVAFRMGRIMQQMSANRQLLCITHLPQIAALGKQHFTVYKKDLDNRTRTFIKQLSADERVETIARMLSADNLTDAAIENAKELLKNTNA